MNNIIYYRKNGTWGAYKQKGRKFLDQESGRNKEYVLCTSCKNVNSDYKTYLYLYLALKIDVSYKYPYFGQQNIHFWSTSRVIGKMSK